VQVSVLPRQFVVVKLTHAAPEFIELLHVHGLFTPLPSMASHGRAEILQEVDASAALHNGSLSPLSPSVLLDPFAKSNFVVTV
jgi:hypothetical protein